jgi:hypothetical protein
MVKIERLGPNSEVVFTRNGKEQRAVVGYLLTDEEFVTLKVVKGELTYSVDELEVITTVATAVDPVPVMEPEPVEAAVVDAPKPAAKKVASTKKK